MEEPSWLQVYVAFAVTVGGYALSVIYIPRILLGKREPSATLSWVFLILIFPYGGVILYTLLGNNRVRRRAAAKVESDARLARHLQQMRPGQEAESALEGKVHPSLLAVSKNLGAAPPTSGNSVRLYTDGPAAFGALVDAIDKAKHHVHVEVFLFRHDRTGKHLVEALARAARRGVQVRVQVDAVGKFMTLTPTSFFDPITQAGGEFVSFLPVGLIRGWSVFNLRNHRKLVVIDGRIAFTGGMNVGDEYAGLKDPHGLLWRDLLVRIEGPAAAQLQEVFASDWFFATGKNLADPGYFPPTDKTAGDSCVQVIPSGPDDSLARLHRLTLALIASARQQLYITTPYFVPDPALVSALEQVALQGVDVRLLVPRRSNHFLVKWAGRSYYEELLGAGVTVHEYAEGMLHAKALVVDGAMTSVGSANMDIRSFRLNFEINTFVYGQGFASRIEEEFVRDTLASHRVTTQEFAKRPHYHKYAETAARVLSPVL